MGRPKKNADEKRTEWIRARATLAERETVRSNAAKAGLAGDESEFIRRRVLGLPLPSSNRSASDPALIAALNNYILSLSRIGNNVNQLTAATHQGRDFAKYWREVGAELEDELRAARIALQRALQESGQ